MSDFPRDLLLESVHRPWPMPDGPWLMTQTLLHFSKRQDALAWAPKRIQWR